MKTKTVRTLIIAATVAIIALVIFPTYCVGYAAPKFGVALSCRTSTAEKYHPVFVLRVL